MHIVFSHSSQQKGIKPNRQETITETGTRNPPHKTITPTTAAANPIPTGPAVLIATAAPVLVPPELFAAALELAPPLPPALILPLPIAADVLITDIVLAEYVTKSNFVPPA